MLKRFNYKITVLGSNATNLAKQISKTLPESSWIEKTPSFQLQTFDKTVTKAVVEEVAGKSIWCCKVDLIPWSKSWILNKAKLTLPLLGLAFSVLVGIGSYKLIETNSSIDTHFLSVVSATKRSAPNWKIVVFKAIFLPVTSMSIAVIIYGIWLSRWEYNNESEYFCSRHTTFCKSSCTGGNFRNLNLSSVNFIQADLTGADLSGADLSFSALVDAVLTGANLSNAVLIGTDFTGAVLRDACLRNSNLTGANLTGVDLTGVDVEGAILDKAYFLSVSQSLTSH